MNNLENTVFKLREKTQLCISLHPQSSEDSVFADVFLPKRKINPLAVSYQSFKKKFPWIQNLHFDRRWQWKKLDSSSNSNASQGHAQLKYRIGQSSLTKQPISIMATWQIQITCQNLAEPYQQNLKILIEHLKTEIQTIQAPPFLLECHLHFCKIQTSTVRLNHSNCALGLNAQLYNTKLKADKGITKITKTICIAFCN